MGKEKWLVVISLVLSLSLILRLFVSEIVFIQILGISGLAWQAILLLLQGLGLISGIIALMILRRDALTPHHIWRLVSILGVVANSIALVVTISISRWNIGLM